LKDPATTAAADPEDVEMQPENPVLEQAAAPRDAEARPEPIGVDTHCHLFLMDDEPGGVLEAARGAGVGRLVCVGIDPETSRRSAALAQSFRGVFATAGVHPHTASGFDRRAGSAIEELLADPLVVGVGETGLDYYRRLSSPEDQQRAFRTHLALSRETAKPVIVHVRDAWDDALQILADEQADRVILHCFSGDREIAREAGSRGYFVSFAANVTYPRADRLREAAAEIPLERMLVETDSPFLPPQHLRGRENRPSNLPSVAEAIAEARGLSAEEVLHTTARAARTIFQFHR